MSFTVSSGGAQWSNFKLKTDFVATTCYSASGTIEITVPGPGSVSSSQFSYSSSTFSFTGQFTSEFTASGTYSFTNRQIVIGIPNPPYVCYYYLTQSGTWTASAPLPPPGSFSKASPANGAVDQSVNPTLTWNPSAYADNYQYCIDEVDNGDCDTSWEPNPATSNTSIAVSGLARSTTYYWQVRSTNSTDTTLADGNVWWSFTTLPPAPDAFTKSSPADGSIDQPIDLSLNWNPATGATSYEYCYYAEGNPSACNEPWTLSTTNTSVSLSGLSGNTKYYWQVRAVNVGGKTNADGGTWWAFTTVKIPPAPFNKTTPTDGAINQLLTPTISWESALGASSYQYCVYQAGDVPCADDAWTDNGTATTATLSLLPTTTYYWHVRAVSLDGTTYSNGSDTAFWSFTTRPQLKVYSVGTQDGWILESTEISNAGGTMNASATTFNLGDGTADKQYRSILSFNTASLPDTAVITKVTLKIRVYGALVGNNNPFTWGQGLKVDVCKGTFGTSALQLTDFNFNNATNCRLLAGTFGSTPTSGWYTVNLVSAALTKVNPLGLTQFRLRFYKDDNDDNAADYWRFYSGNYATITLRPTLIIEYYIP